MRDIGDRIKENYENRARHTLTRRTPVIIRVDGRAFHTWTRGLSKPFDEVLIAAMANAALCVADDMQGCRAAYVQSDEVSFLLTDYADFATEAWFGYVKSKIESVAASSMTAWFNKVMPRNAPAMFDARSFNIPREEVANYFLWRALDWERNSVTMYCNSVYSHREMHGKGKADQHEMLHAKGMNWTTDLSDQIKNGTWIVNGVMHMNVLPNYQAISELLEPIIYCDKVPCEV